MLPNIYVTDELTTSNCDHQKVGIPKIGENKR
jgi:hypothetical protein